MILERYLAREILRPVIGVFVFLLLVILIFYAGQFLARAAVEGLPMAVVTQLGGLRIGLFLDTLVPISLLLGIVIGLGRLQAAHEITALAAAGGGRRRILLALGLWVMLAAALTAALSMVYRPWAYATIYAMERGLAEQIDLERIEPGRFQVGDQQWLIYAEGRSDGGLDDVMVHQREDDYSSMLRAERLEQERDDAETYRLVLTGNVHSYRLSPEGGRDLIGRFDRFETLVPAVAPPEREQLRRAMSMSELVGSPELIEQAELQWRLVAPLSVLVLSLAAVAMSRINPRLGQSARVLSATILGTVYFSVLGVFINWLEQGTLMLWPGAFLAPLLVLLGLMIRYWLVQRGPGAPL